MADPLPSRKLEAIVSFARKLSVTWTAPFLSLASGVLGGSAFSSFAVIWRLDDPVECQTEVDYPLHRLQKVVLVLFFPLPFFFCASEMSYVIVDAVASIALGVLSLTSDFFFFFSFLR